MRRENQDSFQLQFLPNEADKDSYDASDALPFVFPVLEEQEKSKSIMDLKNIFKNQSTLLQRIICITTKEGMGQTTFCQFLGAEWAKGNLWANHFILVLHIEPANIYDNHESNLLEIIIGKYYSQCGFQQTNYTCTKRTNQKRYTYIRKQSVDYNKPL